MRHRGTTSVCPSVCVAHCTAGMLVTYARPFVPTRRGLPRLKVARHLTAELLESREILARRNTVYAHTDDSPNRRILEFRDPTMVERWLRADAVFSEEWHHPAEAMLRDLMELARIHLDSFTDEANEVGQLILVSDEPEPAAG